MWTRHEKRADLEKALSQSTEYNLPIKVDVAEWDGLSGN